MTGVGGEKSGAEVRTKFVGEVVKRIFHRQRDPPAEGAERSDLHGVEEVIEEGSVDEVTLFSPRFGDEFLPAGRADAAGKTLPAGLIGGELEEVLDLLDHRHALRDADDPGVAEEKSGIYKRLEVHREFVDFLHEDEPAERPPRSARP